MALETKRRIFDVLLLRREYRPSYVFVIILLVVARKIEAERISGFSDGIKLNGTYRNGTQLINTILEGYDSRLRPNFGDEALVLDMDLVVASFDSVSEVNMDFTITIYLHQYWRDERLAWYEGVRNESITLSGDDASTKVWVPDTFLANDKHSYLHDVTETNKMLKLYSDGYIAYGMRFTTTLACKMDLHSFPLDKQNISVEIESYGYTKDDLFMRWKNGNNSIRMVNGTEVPQFRITSYTAAERDEVTGTGVYQRLSLVIYLRRDVGYFIFQTYLPSILIVALSWISFWINHEATAARVALGVTTVLTMTTISTGVRGSLPRISYVKAIDIYLVVCFVFVFAALLEYAAVNYTYWGGSRVSKKRHRLQRTQSSEETFSPLESSPRKATGEFPSWETYLKNERDAIADVACRQRRRGTAKKMPRTLDTSEDELDDTDGAGSYTDEETYTERKKIDFDDRAPSAKAYEKGIDAAAEAENAHYLEANRLRTDSSRSSPIPGLMRQLQHQQLQQQLQQQQQTPTSSGAITAFADDDDEAVDAGNWTALINDASPRLPTPPGILYAGGGARPHKIQQQISAFDSIEPGPSSSQHMYAGQQQPTCVTEIDGQRVTQLHEQRRPAHPRRRLGGLRGRNVSFSFWRGSNNATPASSGASSLRMTGRQFNFGSSRRQFVTSLRRKARAVRAVIPRIRDVNVIDKRSRILFPLSFVLFNFGYWCYYVIMEWSD